MAKANSTESPYPDLGAEVRAIVRSILVTALTKAEEAGSKEAGLAWWDGLVVTERALSAAKRTVATRKSQGGAT